MGERICSVPTCDRRFYGRDMCNMHYQRWRRYGDPSIDIRPELKMTTLERFRAKVAVADDGCWMWTAGLGRTGYGTFHDSSRDVYAHRWAYEHFVGPVPDGLELDHLCHTNNQTCPGGTQCEHRRCVNPAHLEPVTTRENTLRGNSFAAVHAAKTECIRGHPFDETNTYRISDGGRGCRTCRAEKSRRWWQKQKAQEAT